MKNLCFFLLILFLLPVPLVFGDEIKLVPSASVKEEYNDNIFFSVADRESDFRTTLSPALDFSDRNERLDAGLHVGVNGILYAQGRGPDSLDQNYVARLGYRLTERGTVSSEAGYLVDSQPDRELVTTGLVTGAVKRHSQHYSLGGEYALTEKVSASLSYLYQQDDYHDPRFSDLSYHDVSLSVSHDMSRFLRATKATVSFDYSHYDSSNSTTFSTSGQSVDSFSATIGGASSLNELWSVQGSVGGRYTITDYTQTLLGTPESKQRTHDTGFVGRLALVYSGEKSTGSLSFNSDVQPASGQVSGTTVRTSVVTNWSRRFTHDLTGTAQVGYFHNKSNPGAFSTQRIDQDVVLLSPAVRYDVNNDLSLEGSYEYTREFIHQNGTEVDRNTVFVRVYIQHPFLQ